MLHDGGVLRRNFLHLKAAGIAAPLVSAQAPKRHDGPVRFGLIGCGGRGRFVASEIVNKADGQIVALADLFDDRVSAAKKQFDELNAKRGVPSIDSSRLFTGVDAAKQMAQSDVDAVLIAITPYYYPQVIEQAVLAGKHIYCEKPVATDVAGCMKVAQLAAQADGKITFHVGFQLPYVPALQELVRRVHDGAIGEIVTGEGCFYYSGATWVRPEGANPQRARMRVWHGDRVLSGDIVVEQNVHSLDKINWMMASHPVAAVASGGRGYRKDFGNVWDHYNAILRYPNGVEISFRSTQFLKGWSSVAERFFGTKGVTEAHYDGPVAIHGENPWNAGVKGTRVGAEEYKVRAFINDIVTGQYRNEGFRGVESTLSAILIRTAAYENREVTWDGVISSNQRWEPPLDLEQVVKG
jgi:myo-inositol 2-dehydrogenase/D-chiro-inositol 1-dehydrogenase